MAVDSKVFDKVMYNIEMSIIGGVEECSESLIILMIHPRDNLLFLISFVQPGLTIFIHSFFGFFDKEHDDIKMSFECELV